MIYMRPPVPDLVRKPSISVLTVGRKSFITTTWMSFGRIYRFRNRFRCKRCFFFLNLDMRRVGMDVENRHRSFLNNEEKRRIDYFGEGS